VLALLVTGCGVRSQARGPSEAPSGRANGVALSAAAYRSAATRTCGQYRREVSALAVPRTVVQLDRYVGSVRSLTLRHISELRALHPPAALAPGVRALDRYVAPGECRAEHALDGAAKRPGSAPGAGRLPRRDRPALAPDRHPVASAHPRLRRVILGLKMATDLVILIILIGVFIGIPIYMWQRHGWNMIAASASAILNFRGQHDVPNAGGWAEGRRPNVGSVSRRMARSPAAPSGRSRSGR